MEWKKHTTSNQSNSLDGDNANIKGAVQHSWTLPQIFDTKLKQKHQIEKLKGIFSDSSTLFLWHYSIDIDEKTLFPKFQLILILRLRVTLIFVSAIGLTSYHWNLYCRIYGSGSINSKNAMICLFCQNCMFLTGVLVRLGWYRGLLSKYVKNSVGVNEKFSPPQPITDYPFKHGQRILNFWCNKVYLVAGYRIWNCHLSCCRPWLLPTGAFAWRCSHSPKSAESLLLVGTKNELFWGVKLVMSILGPLFRLPHSPNPILHMPLVSGYLFEWLIIW